MTFIVSAELRNNMGQYLNRDNTGFIEAKNGIFVDKSECVSLLNKFINTKNKYICVSRPRRFGKSMDDFLNECLLFKRL